MVKENKFPIGIFDSGVGGTSIWKEVNALLPKENTIYLSDSKNAPYGEKSKQDIIDLSIKNTKFLIQQNCKIIIVACNTATTNAIKVLREKYSIPFIGIEPAIKTAALQTKTNTIGILATKGTLNSELFEKTAHSINQKITRKEIIGTGLVDLIEGGKLHSKEMTALLTSYVHPLIKQNVDCLVLGCTHYPYLIPQIRKLVGTKIQIIDSGEAVARQTKNILEKHQLINSSTKESVHQFFINKDKEVLKMLVSNKAKRIKITEKDF
ncbi:glutamate racemase [Polaribacter sp. Z014]|uniref:glutamate racemase n=1 Tax=unclassified Polaribacter TaxID=196858 RepID=UPI00193AFFA4|nr:MULTISPECIES: glutamate racemase [unclassified Polaribacter]MCL7764268.1 glutamate racemase [Polaribacter sp. Z014]QVY65071.1 glutamate racemase [Polaribacter sp. Q13]